MLQAFRDDAQGEGLGSGVTGDAACVRRLQDHVKAVIAPYKYPRAVTFIEALPKTQTGKIQRFKLRQW
jgi:2-aminobenzoate-CoA ligase